MRLNNKGFAISSIIYIILVIVILLISMSLLNLSNIKLVLDKLSDEAYNNVYLDTNNIVVDLKGMTPVLYDGSNWVVADTSQKWYDYDNQEWANAVILKSEYRDKDAGDIVDVSSEVMAIFVYIPRYQYKIRGSYGKGGISLTTPGEIEVKFIESDQILADTGYTIHPAFWWDDNSNGVVEEGEQLSGIWVGKFETSHSTISLYQYYPLYVPVKNNLGCSNEDCSSADGIVILPNKTALTNNTVSNMFYASRSMERSGNPFGLDSSKVDTHMMKNSEWGAVAYLSQSKYGKYGNPNYLQKEIVTNNSDELITGVAAESAISLSCYQEGNCDTIHTNTYDTVKGQAASTTGNITGIYDMNGGVNEYVMANYNNIISSSEFTVLPQSKYIDIYTSTTKATACNSTICYGHALSETNGWYNDGEVFVTESSPWLQRGGWHDSGATARGIFYTISEPGHSDFTYGFRITLT